jgi:hypothetical protein
VEVDDAAPLVFGDLGEGHPDVLAQAAQRQAGELGNASAQRVGEPPPQLGRHRVEQHGRGVVVAVGAQRLTEPRIVTRVPDGAGERPTVRADRRVAARVARQDPAVVFPAGVDGPERRRGQGEEQAWVGAHRLGDAFAADQARAEVSAQDGQREARRVLHARRSTPPGSRAVV